MKKLFYFLLFIPLISGCIQLEAPKANYRDVRVSNVNLQGARLDFMFDVENKNPIAVEITNYTYQVEINGRELVNNTGGGITIEAQASKMLTLPVQLRWDRVFDSVVSIAANLMSDKMYLDYKVTGSLTAGTMGLTTTAPLNASGRINIPKQALNLPRITF